MSKSFSLAGTLMLPPLVGLSDSLPKATGFWLLSVILVTLYATIMLALRTVIGPRLRLALSVLLAVTLVSCSELLIRAWGVSAVQDLGLYLPLISLQCVLLEQGGFFAPGTQPARWRLFAGFGALLIGLSLLRQFIAGGTLATFAAPGFILLGLMIAGQQAWSSYSKSH